MNDDDLPERLDALDTRLQILRVVVSPANNNEIFDTAADKEFAVMHEPQVTRSQVIATSGSIRRFGVTSYLGSRIDKAGIKVFLRALF